MNILLKHLIPCPSLFRHDTSNSMFALGKENSIQIPVSFQDTVPAVLSPASIFLLLVYSHKHKRHAIKNLLSFNLSPSIP